MKNNDELKEKKIFYIALPKKILKSMNQQTLTCPGSSLRNSDKVTSDLTWSKMNV